MNRPTTRPRCAPYLYPSTVRGVLKATALRRKPIVTAILGINAYHADASASLVVDGRLVAAAEEERFKRIKHWAGFPADSILYCLKTAGITAADLSHIAVNTDRHANIASKLVYAMRRRPSLKLIVQRLTHAGHRAGVSEDVRELANGTPFRGPLTAVEHHQAHLASAFWISPFDKAVTLSIDGFGDFRSAAWGLGRGTQLKIDGGVGFPHSLGVFYQALTQFLGFPHYGDEYKVMGLGAYGAPVYMDQMRKLVMLRKDGGYALDLQYFRHHREGFSYKWSGGIPEVGPLFSAELSTLLGPPRAPTEPMEQRHRDIASSVQAMYEEAFFHLLNQLHPRYHCDNLALAGGCAMNSLANGKIGLYTPFTKVYVQSAAGDAGGAIGAAFEVFRQSGGQRDFVMNHAYWGPDYAADTVRAEIDARRSKLEGENCRVEKAVDEQQLLQRVAARIAQGSVVGWFQGRMEWGPRALGNRSILGDPRRADMKDILNLKIKRRESFRPFAPSVLRERVAEWFERDGDVPFMMQVFPIRADKRAQIPAVTHVDGTGRLQTVSADANPRYHALISEFERQTGVPMVLNTSFNENEPVVCQPQEALDCFLRTKMDVLVLGDYLIERWATTD
ncbi:MAG TPA: carbamoyltransferase C-terminal domain-containing protein [Verrucomicrobiae bacterium]|nr:carbamoyltransferase C-terminal domain-containing protein [Verrucomicrobiae bacterium]